MQQNRRHFLKVALTSAVWIGAGKSIKTFAGAKFNLPAKDEVKLRVVIASDGHFGQPQTAFEANHAEMVSWINAEGATRGVDFTFINGDLFHNDISFVGPVKDAWDKLDMPYYVSHGNHDMIDEKSWKETWNYNWDYGFEKKGIGFIVLNTADVKGTYISPEVEKTKQLLKQYEKHKQVFVFMHITPIKWTENGIDCPDIVKMFNKQENLKAVFHGHDHDQDNMKERDGQLYFFDSHVSGNWGTDYRGYRVLEVMKNGDILTYQMNPGRQQQVNSRRMK